MKFTRASVPHILTHDERTKADDKQYKNIDIDRSKTHLNYSYVNSDISAQERFNKRLNELNVFKRADVNVLCSWVVTLPEKVAEKGDEKQFFDNVYKFMSSKYGEKNIIAANVHKDETTPHCHIDFIPVVANKKKNAQKSEKVSAKELLNMRHLQKFHNELDSYLKMQMGYETGVLNGVTKQNKTVKELKKETENELEKLKSISEIKDKSGIFGKVIISAEKYQTLKNAPNEIKKLTEDYINSKNGERLKNVLAENESLKSENAKLKRYAADTTISKAKELEEMKQKAQKAIDKAKAEAAAQIEALKAATENEIKEMKACIRAYDNLYPKAQARIKRLESENATMKQMMQQSRGRGR